MSWPLFNKSSTARNGDGAEVDERSGRARCSRATPAPRSHDRSARTAQSAAASSSFTAATQLVSIEGDPASPISAGHLCPKGAASYELLTHPDRADEGQVPRAARDRVAGPRSRDRDGHDRRSRLGVARPHVRRGGRRQAADAGAAIAHLGGATLDNEENYLIKKLFAAGLGMVAVEQSGPDMT